MATSPTVNFVTSPNLTQLTPPRIRSGRARAPSIVKVEKVGENSQEQVLDQGAYANINAEWVNRKGMFRPL